MRVALKEPLGCDDARRRLRREILVQHRRACHADPGHDLDFGWLVMPLATGNLEQLRSGSGRALLPPVYPVLRRF